MPASISVRVHDGTEPLEGALVSLHGLEGQKKVDSVTRQDGSADFRGLAPGRYRLSAAKSGFEPHSDNDETVTAFGSCQESGITLRPRNNLNGLLVGDGGEPIPDVEMHLFQTDPEEEPAVPISVSVTDERGAFRFEGVPSGRYRLAANGHSSSTGTLVVPGFYPGGTKAEAARVFEMGPGAAFDGLTFQIAGMGRATRLSVSAAAMDGSKLLLP